MSYEIHDLAHQFAGPDDRPRTILDIPKLDIQAGKITAITGTNGAGKTTLLEILAGLRIPTQGKIRCNLPSNEETQPADKPYHQHLQSASAVMVMHPGYMFHGSVRKNIAFGPKARNWSAAKIHDRVDEMLRRFNLADIARQNARKLSAGQKQRTNLARAVAVMPAILLIDEPISNLDDQSIAMVAEIFSELRRDGRSIIYAAPAAGPLAAITDRTIRLEAGRIVEDSA